MNCELRVGLWQHGGSVPCSYKPAPSAWFRLRAPPTQRLPAYIHLFTPAHTLRPDIFPQESEAAEKAAALSRAEKQVLELTSKLRSADVEVAQTKAQLAQLEVKADKMAAEVRAECGGVWGSVGECAVANGVRGGEGGADQGRQDCCRGEGGVWGAGGESEGSGSDRMCGWRLK